MLSPPAGFEPLQGIRARGFARREALEWASAALTRWGTLDRASARADDALSLEGRGEARAVPAPDGGRWVVRRYHRGGAVAPLLGDRHLRRGVPRPWVETRASESARDRGIPTPRVVAGAVYPTGLFYRADLVTEYLPDTVDLAALLFGEAPSESFKGARLRTASLRAAGALAAKLADAGILHRDLNAKNLLVHSDAGRGPTLYVLDLDRARVRPPGTADPGRMGSRLERSLRKFEQSSGMALGELEWRALADGLGGGGRS